MACVFEVSGWMLLVLKICPKYWISLEKKWHLLNFMKSFADHSFLNAFLITSCRQLRFSLYSGAVTTKAVATVVFLYYSFSQALWSILCLMPLA